MTWCLLVHLKMAERYEGIKSDVQVHVRIMKWLSDARKRKLFPKEAARDLLWLHNQGQKYGVSALLLAKVLYIYHSGARELRDQSELFCFSFFIETLKSMGWRNHHYTEAQLLKMKRDDNTNACAVYIATDILHPSFSDDDMRLLVPLTLRFTGNCNGLDRLLKECNLTFEHSGRENGFTMITLLPRTDL